MENSFSHSNQSGKRRVGLAFILAVALGSCVSTELRAQVVVVPNTLATNDGNSSFTSPEGSGVQRVMQLIDASQFAALSGPSFLTQLSRRPDTIPGPSGPRTAILRIYASTTSRSVAGMSTTFADNLGANHTLVFDGTVTLSTENLPGPGNTRQFDIVYPFTTPFLYDPADGNLLVELQQRLGTPMGSGDRGSVCPHGHRSWLCQRSHWQLQRFCSVPIHLCGSGLGHDPGVSSGSVLEQPIEPHVSSAVSLGSNPEPLDFSWGLHPEHQLHDLYL